MLHEDHPLAVHALEVTSMVEVAESVVALTLRDPGGGLLPAWAPGAHIDLLLPDGMDRQYSLCGDPGDRRSWTIAVLHEPDGRGGSAHVHRAVQPGDAISCRGPRNAFALEDASAYRFVAGGIGITPILPMVRDVAARGLPWRLLYGGRRRGSMAFVDELVSLGGAVTIAPEDPGGPLDLDAFLGEQPTGGAAVYGCGPEGLLNAIERRSERWPAGTLHLERFRPREVPARSSDAGFSVRLAQTGGTYAVAPGQTIVEALEDAGIDVVTSCREGTCGTCETVVVDGVPDHRDSVLSRAERQANDVIMVCCSRAETPLLVLDL